MVKIEKAGTYTFITAADDSVKIKVDGDVVADNKYADN